MHLGQTNCSLHKVPKLATLWKTAQIRWALANGDQNCRFVAKSDSCSIRGDWPSRHGVAHGLFCGGCLRNPVPLAWNAVCWPPQNFLSNANCSWCSESPQVSTFVDPPLSNRTWSRCVESRGRCSLVSWAPCRF